jgi:hypothetical protein
VSDDVATRRDETSDDTESRGFFLCVSPGCSFHPKSREEGKQKKTDSDRKAVISPTGVGDAEEEWGGEEGTREVREQREARRWEAEAVLLLLILFNSLFSVLVLVA